jgi:hypothetical protein
MQQGHKLAQNVEYLHEQYYTMSIKRIRMPLKVMTFKEC